MIVSLGIFSWREQNAKASSSEKDSNLKPCPKSTCRIDESTFDKMPLKCTSASCAFMILLHDRELKRIVAIGSGNLAARDLAFLSCQD